MSTVKSEIEKQNDALGLSNWADDGGFVPDEDCLLASGSTIAEVALQSNLSQSAVNKKISSLNRKAAVVAKPVYSTLATHQAEEADWDFHGLYVFLEEWYARFDDKFRLGLPRVPLRLDPRIRRNCAGYFLPGHNEFGLVYEIAIAVPPPEQLVGIDRGDVLGTLLHEQFHLLQELTGISGRNNYHNSQYRATAERFGLLVDHRGHQGYAIDSLFLDLLTEFGVELPFAVQVEKAALLGEPCPPVPQSKKAPGRSKLRKWSCGCTNVRVGVAAFHARCTREDCGKPYHPC